MTVRRLDNVLIVVEDLDAATAFFTELGLQVEGRARIEGPWVDETVGLEGVRTEIVMLRTPDGGGRVELSRFLSPPAVRPEPHPAPSNALGLRRIMFTVEGLDDVLGRLRRLGAELVGGVARYGDAYRLCFVRAPEGYVVGLAEELGQASGDEDRGAGPPARAARPSPSGAGPRGGSPAS